MPPMMESHFSRVCAGAERMRAEINRYDGATFNEKFATAVAALGCNPLASVPVVAGYKGDVRN